MYHRRRSWVEAAGYAALFTPTPVQRSGFTINSGCALQSANALPSWWKLVYSGNSYSVATRPNGNGPNWWKLDVYPYNSTSSYTSSSYQVSSGCYQAQYGYSYGIGMPSIYLGSDYIEINP